jgi:hypothetical protein
MNPVDIDYEGWSEGSDDRPKSYEKQSRNFYVLRFTNSKLLPNANAGHENLYLL